MIKPKKNKQRHLVNYFLNLLDSNIRIPCYIFDMCNMKTNIVASIFCVCFCCSISYSYAQNKTYLLLEYLKVKPGQKNIDCLIDNACERIRLQTERDNSVIRSSIWKMMDQPDKTDGYEYIVATVFSTFNQYLQAYVNGSKNAFIAVSDDSIIMLSKNAIKLNQALIFEVVADTWSKSALPKLLMCTQIRTAPGKKVAYESTQLSDWMPIHENLIKNGFERAFNCSKLIFPYNFNTPYDFCIFQFFDDEQMYDKQNDIDWQPYIQKNQSAFVNTGMMGTEVNTELLSLVAVLQSNEQ